MGLHTACYALLLYMRIQMSVAGGSWKNESGVAETYQKTRGTPYHIEADRYIPGNLLYSDLRALYTTDSTTNQIVIGQSTGMSKYQEGIGKNATFSYIRSFAQLNETHVIIADSARGCIRIINRITNQTRRLVGICDDDASSFDRPTDGDLQTSTFNKLACIAYFRGVIYVLEEGKQKVRKVSLALNTVATIVRNDAFRGNFHHPLEIVIDPNISVGYISINYGIAQLNLTDESFKYLNHQKWKGYKDGPILISQFSWLSGLALAQNDTIFAADTNNNKLRVINLAAMSVSTWCFDSGRIPEIECEVSRPRAVLVVGCNLYFSIPNSIAKLKLPDWFCDEDSAIQHKSKDDETKVPIALISGLTASAVAVIILIVGLLYCLTKKRLLRAQPPNNLGSEYNTFATGISTATQTVDESELWKNK